MPSICRVLGHQRPPTGIWNDGLFFSACPRCGSHLIKRGNEARWKDVPRGFRVEWKPLGEYDVRW